MNWNQLATQLFGSDHGMRARRRFPAAATCMFDGQPIAVVGTTNHAPIGVELALAQARVDARHVARASGPADPAAGRHAGPAAAPARRDCWASTARWRTWACCIDLARRRGHRGDRPGVRPGAVGRLHHLGPDRRRLLRAARGRDPRDAHSGDGARDQAVRGDCSTALSQSNPVFAPGVGNYVAMGGVRALWEGDLAAALREALADTPVEDTRAQDGAAARRAQARRGGRAARAGGGLSAGSRPWTPLRRHSWSG